MFTAPPGAPNLQLIGVSIKKSTGMAAAIVFLSMLIAQPSAASAIVIGSGAGPANLFPFGVANAEYEQIYASTASMLVGRKAGTYAFLLLPLSFGRQCRLCFQRQVRPGVTPHRDGRLGVFWVCGSCQAMVSVL